MSESLCNGQTDLSKYGLTPSMAAGRRQCDTCIRKSAGKKIGGVTALQRSGYKKRKKCELCGFKAQDKAQMDVLFVDGNLRNTTNTNLKTVCANCQRLTSTRRLGWRVGDLIADD